MLFTTCTKTAAEAIKANNPVTIGSDSTATDTVIATIAVNDDYNLIVNLSALDWSLSADDIAELVNNDSAKVTYEFLGDGKLIDFEFTHANTIESFVDLDSNVFEYCGGTLENRCAVVEVLSCPSTHGYDLDDVCYMLDRKATILSNSNQIDNYFSNLAEDDLHCQGIDTSNPYIDINHNKYKREYLMDIEYYGDSDDGPLVIVH